MNCVPLINANPSFAASLCSRVIRTGETPGLPRRAENTLKYTFAAYSWFFALEWSCYLLAGGVAVEGAGDAVPGVAAELAGAAWP